MTEIPVDASLQRAQGVRVTIGVPVYNAEGLLPQCLENLAGQTYRDFKVVILDNASTDGTAAIARAFAARDPRFEYRCQPRNVGARQNFADVLDTADTPYFMWHADDDLCDVNFIEETMRCLEAAPDAALAVGTAIYEKNGRKKATTFPHRMAGEPRAVYRVRLLLCSRASWIYGLFRTADLKASLRRVLAAYPHVNAFDHLMLFPFLMTLRVVGSKKTALTTRFIDKNDAPAPARRSFLDPGPMMRLRADFQRYCNAYAPKLLPGPVTTALMRPVLWFYAQRSYRLEKILNARLRLMLGQSPTGRAKSYD